jgi:putative acetyltransferase
MDAKTFQIRPASNADRQAVQEIIFSTLREYGMRPDPEGTDADLADLEAHYAARGGSFDVIADPSGSVVGCVGLDRIDGRTVELRKMYLRPDVRGKGLGRRLLDHAVDQARRMGFARITLETASCLRTAIQMYRAYGFRESDETIHASRCDLAMYLDLLPSEDR